MRAAMAEEGEGDGEQAWVEERDRGWVRESGARA